MRTFALAACLLVSIARVAGADGWKIQLQGAGALGTSYAGRSVLADDATVVWFNPAAMSWLTVDSLVTAGAPIITYQLDFNDRGSRSVLRQPLTGSARQDGGRSAVVPHLYAVRRLGARVWSGVGFNAPYGLGTNYGESWVGRYFATETTLKVFNVNPAAAVRVHDRVAVGFGLDVQRSSATLANMIDFGSIGAAVGLPLTPQGSDGKVEFTGTDWAVGYDASLAWDASRTTRVGVAFRSRVDHRLAGTADFTVPASALALTAGGRLFSDTAARSILPMPSELSASASRSLAGGWIVLGDLTWTGWAAFRELRLVFDNQLQPDVRQPADWHNATRVAGGASKHVGPVWTIRGGAAYEMTPVPDATRTPRLPEKNHTWLSAGASYVSAAPVRVDVYLSHLITPDADVNLSDPASGTLTGTVHWRLTTFGLAASLRF
jgi:long-chain fatty acid transport protein